VLYSHYSCQILMKLDFSRHIFEKYSNIKFHENPLIRSRVVPCGWTDRREVTIVTFRPFRTRLEIVKEVKCTGRDFSVSNTSVKGCWGVGI
jgi:hypothetical protein